MPLDKDLIAILCCPRCKGSLDLDEGETAFTCPACKLRYEVVDGVPNFLPDDARPLEVDPAT